MSMELKILRDDGQLIDVVFSDEGDKEEKGTFVSTWQIEGRTFYVRYKPVKGDDPARARMCLDYALLESEGFSSDELGKALARHDEELSERLRTR